MLGLCIIGQRLSEIDHWVYLGWSFSVDQIWVKGPCTSTQEVTRITNLSELPEGHTCVLLATPNAQGIQGDTSLVDFVHPDDVIYVVGGSDFVVTAEDLDGCHLNSKVYIPADGNAELHAPMAGAIALYDRLVKRGGLG